MNIAFKLGLFMLLLWLGLWWFQRSNLYFPTTPIEANPKTFGMTYEEIILRVSPAGPKIRGWYIPAAVPSPKVPVILLCHGNAGNISHRLRKASLLRALGADVFLFDYEGYGQSEGWPNENHLYRDGIAAYDYLRQVRKIPPERIFIYGESLGTAVAVELAAREPAAGLILESAFTSGVEMAGLIAPWFPARVLLHDRFDSLSKLPRISTPLLMLHSPEDEIIPYRMGRRLYESSPAKKHFAELSGDHNGGYELSGRMYTDAIRNFIKDGFN